MQQQPATVVVINYADLAAECERAKAEARRSLLAAGELISYSGVGLTDEQRHVIEAHETLLMVHLEATQAWYVAELARHFPGQAPAIVAVWEHVRDEASRGDRCCELEA